MLWLIVALVFTLFVSGISQKIMHNRLKQKEEQIQQLKAQVEEYSRQLSICQTQVQKSQEFCNRRIKNYQQTTEKLLKYKKLREYSHEETGNDVILNELNRMFSEN